MAKNKIVHEFSVHYYHQSNGRVERVNITIRSAIKKTKGAVRIKLRNKIENHKNAFNRGIGISLNEAVRLENHKLVLDNSLRYRKEFKSKRKIGEKFRVNENFLIKDETRTIKNHKLFSEKGTILENIYGDVYMVKNSKDKEIIRHSTRLKEFK